MMMGAAGFTETFAVYILGYMTSCHKNILYILIICVVFVDYVQ
jgi:hypothetical protein